MRHLALGIQAFAVGIEDQRSTISVGMHMARLLVTTRIFAGVSRQAPPYFCTMMGDCCAFYLQKYLESGLHPRANELRHAAASLSEYECDGCARPTCNQHHHSQRKPLAKSRSEKRPTLNVRSARNSLSQWPTRATAGANPRK